MASDYSNLNFFNGADVSRWKEQCEEQRKVALTYPAYDVKMGSVEEYGWKLGPWSLRLVLEIWKRPYMWHGSAACIEHIGYETVTADEGMYKGAKFEIPQDALLATRSWEPEHLQQARYILGELFGSILTPGDKHQLVQETLGLWAMHWRTKYIGKETWKEKQH